MYIDNILIFLCLVYIIVLLHRIIARMDYYNTEDDNRDDVK